MAAEEKIVVTAIGGFAGTSIKKNKGIDISFKFSYDERINIVKSIAFISQNIEVVSRRGKEKARQLGIFRFQGLNMDRDGEATLKFNSELENVDMEAINDMIINDGELVKIRMQANIEMEDKE